MKFEKGHVPIIFKMKIKGKYLNFGVDRMILKEVSRNSSDHFRQFTSFHTEYIFAVVV